MTPEVQELFEAAHALDADARRAFLERECRDATTRREVASLLAAFDRAPRLFDEPAFALAKGDLDDALAGRRAGAYRLVEVVGEGGMGTVWRGVRDDDQFTRQVAVKVLKRGLDTAELLARFRTERQTLASLQHPHVVALLDAGSLADGRPYVVMEYVDGMPIDRYCRENRLGLDQRLALFLQVTAAVSYAHQRLVVHRDLKPSNVLVTPAGAVKLLDFGIAKILSGGGGETRPGRAAPRTLRYASPEQVRGGAITTASDVYSLGVLLYELLAGNSPYRDPRSAGLERSVVSEPPPPPSAAAPPAMRRRLAGDLDTIALHALAKEPERRYASVEQLADDLERHRAGLPVRARPETFLYRAGKLLRRRRFETAALAVVVASLAWAAVASRMGLERARRSEGVAWQAHADAVYVTSYLAAVLERAARGELDGEADVLAVLGDAEARIAGELADSPEAEARLRYAVARAYLGLGRLEDAERHARRALELSRSTIGLGSRDVERNVELLNEITVRRATSITERTNPGTAAPAAPPAAGSSTTSRTSGSPELSSDARRDSARRRARRASGSWRRTLLAAGRSVTTWRRS